MRRSFLQKSEMVFMNEANTYDYDAQVRAIQAYNQPILDGS